MAFWDQIVARGYHEVEIRENNHEQPEPPLPERLNPSTSSGQDGAQAVSSRCAAQEGSFSALSTDNKSDPKSARRSIFALLYHGDRRELNPCLGISTTP